MHLVKHTTKFYLLAFLLVVVTSKLSFTQNDTIDPYLFNLSQLAGLEVVEIFKIKQEIKNVPATIKIISDEEIRNCGYFTLEEALSDLPGFQFRNILGLNSYVFQRGAPSQNNLILVLIDGVQINELNSGGFYAGGQFNLANVERIEVVYGPASALYGTNAVSGIINIVTKDFANKNFNANLLYGSFNTYYADINYGFLNKAKDFGVQSSLMYKSSEKANLIGDEGDNNWTEEMENFENDIAFDTKMKYKSIIAGVNFQHKQTSATTYYPSVGTIYWDHGSVWNIQFLNTYAKHQYSFSDKLKLNSKLYYRNASVKDNSVRDVVDTAQIGFYRPNFLLGFESNLNYIVNEKLMINSGVVFENENLAEQYSKSYSNSPTEKPETPAKPNMLNNNLLSFYIQSQYEIIKPLQFFAGLRFDHSSYYEQVLTPRAGVLFNRNKFNAKVLYMDAFRAPKPWDYTSGIGSTNLKPEKLKSYELASSYYLSKDFRIEMSLYSNHLYDALVRENVGNSFRWINYGIINTKGVEFSLFHKLENQFVSFNYTFNNSVDDANNLIPEIAKHSFNANVTYIFTENYRINIRANYLGKRKNHQYISATHSDMVKEALVFNFTLSALNIHNFNIQLIAKNLLDVKYYHTSNRLPERYRQPQRTILLKLGYALSK